MTTTSLVRLLAASAVGVLLGGCVAVPADPYYDAAPAYPTYPGTYPQTYPNAYPVYPVPHPGYDARAAERERWEQNRDRQAWREREQRQERERALQRCPDRALSAWRPRLGPRRRASMPLAPTTSTARF